MKKIWRTHTGSAPGCQDGPRAQISAWFNGAQPLLRDAAACFANLIEVEEQFAEAAEQIADYDEGHRCFNRREYKLTLRDVRNIIRDLKADYEAY